MEKQIRYCPFCGVEFEDVPDSPDPRSSSGYQCENCHEVLELKVNPFPLA